MKKNLIIVSTIVGIAIFSTMFLINSQTNVNNLNDTPSSQTQVLESNLVDLESTFQQMSDNGWDVNKPLVYGYYFYDRNIERLELFKKRLESEGFNVYEIREGAQNNGNYLLYVYEETVHTPNSLLKQNQRMGDLATQNSIESYDGWEAGPEPL